MKIIMLFIVVVGGIILYKNKAKILGAVTNTLGEKGIVPKTAVQTGASSKTISFSDLYKGRG